MSENSSSASLANRFSKPLSSCSSVSAQRVHRHPYQQMLPILKKTSRSNTCHASGRFTLTVAGTCSQLPGRYHAARRSLLLNPFLFPPPSWQCATAHTFAYSQLSGVGVHLRALWGPCREELGTWAMAAAGGVALVGREEWTRVRTWESAEQVWVNWPAILALD